MPRLTYAIGDIHGRLDLLQQALARIEHHAEGNAHRIISLGDLVDRGPESRAVVDLMMRLTDADHFICLKGNHEEMMLRALRERGQAIYFWTDYGGSATLDSYGWDGVPQAHIDWLEALPLYWRGRAHLYVHAGLLPGTPVEVQDARTLLWIRDRFLEAPADDLPCHVVHGHTPIWAGKPDMSQPELLAHRTNLDTGAYATGVLTVGVFDDDGDGGPVELLTVTQ